jgi:baseplate J-like protein
VKVPLPNLDDRRWADLVDEGRSLIPAFAPEWTDHNVHDPGITLMELWAWVAEMDVYWLNRITDEHRRKFLSLIGVVAMPPRPARTVLSFEIADAATPLSLPASIEFDGRDAFGHETRFRTLEDVTVAPGELKAVQIKSSAGFHDLTERWRRGESFGAFGEIPEPGAELYLGFSRSFPSGEQVSLYLKFAGSYSGEDERRRLIEETIARHALCRPPHAELSCVGKTKIELSEDVISDGSDESSSPEKERIPPHHGARTAWEFLADAGGMKKWMRLKPEAGEAIDDTRSMTLDGRVVLRVTGQMAPDSIGKVEEELYYIRCRFVAGAYDAPPRLQTVIFNAAPAEQSTPASMNFMIAKGVAPGGTAPQPGELTQLRLEFNDDGQIGHLEFIEDENAPEFTALEYRPATAAATGSLTLEAVFAGIGEGKPFQELTLRDAPVDQDTLRLFTLEEGVWREWSLRRDFDASKRGDAHFLLDATAGAISFGDGEQGRTPPRECLIFAAYRATRAEAGNLEARSVTRLADSPRNRALLDDFDQLKERFDCESVQPRDCVTVSNPIAAVGGVAAEDLDAAAARAIELMNGSWRAVTLADYEALAMKTPGVRLARVKAWAGVHPSFPCLKAPGMITLVVLPAMPVARPQPSAGLRRAVAAYLRHRRLVGSRVEVVGPEYREVSVRAKVKAFDGVSKAALRQRITTALDDFFSPLEGGPEGEGWPFGRDVYRSEVLQTIDEVAGVDHVVSMEMIADSCDPQCGNICLAPTQLVAAGMHEIEVI